jgi:hypothetical protein
LENNDDWVTGTLKQWGARKRARIKADSELSFSKYTAKMLLSLVFILLDGIFIPSGFEALGLFTFGYAVPIAIVLIAAAALELKALSLFR